jgi:hypothetical protein
VFWILCLPFGLFSAGIMVPQIQHSGLSPYAGRENFANCTTANNRAAVFPAIAAALGVTVLSVVGVFHPEFFTQSFSLEVKPTGGRARPDATAVWEGVGLFGVGAMSWLFSRLLVPSRFETLVRLGMARNL